MFGENARYGTTHFIIRDHASKLIQLAYCIDPTLFSTVEIKRASPPFSQMGISQWQKSVPQTGAMPLGFEFRQNEVSTLANNPNKYDFNQKDQVEVERKLLWRIKQLGYEEDKFKTIDQHIIQSQPLNRSNHRIHGYGEKYSYIAYYELLGFLYDGGLISLERFNGNKDRVRVKIDPSFPTYNQSNFVVRNLIRKSKDVGRWVKSAPPPNLTKYFIQNNLEGLTGKSILLNGRLSYENKSIKKRLSVFLRGFLIKKDLKNNCIALLNKSPFESLNIPKPYEYRYVYAGEVPWSSNFDIQESDNLISTKHSIRKQPNGSILHSYLDVLNVPTVLPYSEYTWEGTPSINSTTILSKSIIDYFNLQFNPDGMNFYDQSGQQISSLIKHAGPDSFYDNYEFLYLSEKILKKYMDDNDLELIWIIWGERGICFEDNNAISNNQECSWKIFKQVKTY